MAMNAPAKAGQLGDADARTQVVRTAYEPRGRAFESLRARHTYQVLMRRGRRPLFHLPDICPIRLLPFPRNPSFPATPLHAAR